MPVAIEGIEMLVMLCDLIRRQIDMYVEESLSSSCLVPSM